jgi:nitroreductase
VTGLGGDEPRLHPLLAQRWSPTAFDPAHEVSAAEVGVLLEAARWAPSAGNSQPWAFVAARRREPDHARLVAHLAPSSGRWAPAASLLVANLALRLVEGTDWEYSEFALYDLGQAVAHMTVQGRALGLQARQFRAFDREGIEADFAVPPHWQVTSMTAFGHVADPAPARTRRARSDLRWPADGSTPPTR